MELCTVPSDTDCLELCRDAATTRRVVDGVSCALCARHAAELDMERAAERDIADAIEASTAHTEIVSLVWQDEATDAARRDALAVECDDSADHEDGSSEWWGTTPDEQQWRVHLAAAAKEEAS